MNGVKMLGYRNAERFIRELMLIRRTFELMGIDTEDYDKNLQEWTERYHKEFSEMSPADLMFVMNAEVKGRDL